MENKGKIAVVGSGLIGRCWALVFCKAGYSVCLYDSDEKQLLSAMEGVKAFLDEFEQKKLLTSFITTASEAFKLVSSTSSLEEAMKDAIFLQESIPENVELKKKVFQQFDELASSEIILSSSSSCLYPSLFTKDLKNKKRCIVSHPVNPPYLIPLVEIVPSPDTDQIVINKTMAIMKDIGQAPVLVKKEVNGFVLNRLQYAILMEAWRLVEDGVCSPEDIDTTFTHGLGLRYSLIGPFETIHLNAPAGVKDYCERYGANIEAVCKEQTDTRSWSGETANQIHSLMCERIPLDKLNERRALRDKRLAALAVHNKTQTE